MAFLALGLNEHQPPRLVHVPVAGPVGLCEDPLIEGLDQFPDALQARRQSPLGKTRLPVARIDQTPEGQLEDHARERPLEQELLHDDVGPESDREHPLRDQLRRDRRGDDPGDEAAGTGGLGHLALMENPDHFDPDVDLFGILCVRKDDEHGPASRTVLLVFGQGVVDDLRRQLLSSPPPKAPRAPLLPAPPLARSIPLVLFVVSP